MEAVGDSDSAAMRVAWSARRSFPGPGGIPQMMKGVATGMEGGADIRIVAARIDDEAITRMNSTLGAQRFPTRWDSGVEIMPLPATVATKLSGVGLGALSVPLAKRVANAPIRTVTSPPYVAALARALTPVLSGVELVHAWGGEHLNWAAGRAAKKLKVPYVVTPFAHPGHWGDDPLNGNFYEGAARVLALVPSEAEVYERMGVDPSRIDIVGVPVPPFPKVVSEPRRRHAIQDAPLVLFLGAKEQYKGYRLVVESMQQVWRRHPETHFAFVGPHGATSEEEFSGLEDKRVIVRGTVDREELAAWLQEADLLVLPSSSEIFPVVVLEAWASKTPVLAGRWWCASDVVRHGIDGLIVDPGVTEVTDGILALLDDSTSSKSMAEAGYERVQSNYTRKIVAQKHLDSYRRVLA